LAGKIVKIMVDFLVKPCIMYTYTNKTEPNMILVIDTQDQENYAAHQGFTGEYYWKFKGGSSYKILNVPKGADPAEIVELVRGDIEEYNDYFRSAIIGYTLQSDGWISDFERSQLEYEGEITYPEPMIDYMEVA
jgi:hypothetical protein